MRTLAAAVLAATITFSALPSRASDYAAGPIAIEHPWTRATPPNANVAGGYFGLRNDGTENDRIVCGTSAVADRVEIHEMTMTDDVMRMRYMPDGVEIPAGGKVSFAPSAYHLMLIGLDGRLVEGTRVPVTLQFEKAGSVEVELTVDAMGSSGGGGDSSDHGGH